MTKFFRKIRQNILYKGKTKRYVAYALGEILLVVIGILIALQINNWNEKNTAKDVSKIYLTSLASEIFSNTQLLRGSLSETQKSIKISNYYLQLLNQKDANKLKDSVITNMIGSIDNFISFSPTQSTIDDLLNSGALKALEDEQLKKQILEVKFVYEGFKQLSASFEETRSSILIPYFIKNANMTKIVDASIKPVREAFLKNREFNNILFTLEKINSRNERQFRSWIKYLETLLSNIEKHLQEK